MLDDSSFSRSALMSVCPETATPLSRDIQKSIRLFFQKAPRTNLPEIEKPLGLNQSVRAAVCCLPSLRGRSSWCRVPCSLAEREWPKVTRCCKFPMIVILGKSCTAIPVMPRVRKKAELVSTPTLQVQAPAILESATQCSDS